MRSVSTVGEVGLIDRIRRRITPDRSVIMGIGDDAAVLARPHAGQLLFASDMLVEGVHFSRRRTPPQAIGWKALACNISDIAAMGGMPRWAVVSLGLPAATSVQFVDRLYDGLRRCARQYKVAVVGGDTARAPQIVVDVAIVGTVTSGRVVLRRGACVGDQLFVTGRLGGSLRSGRHATFRPRLRESQELARRVPIHAMMDLSDGLASDAWQMSRASRVVLRIEPSCLPLSRDARTADEALQDGEDFELLFAVGPDAASRVPRRIGACPVTRIGSVVGRGVRVEIVGPDGTITRLQPTGFHHF